MDFWAFAAIAMFCLATLFAIMWNEERGRRLNGRPLVDSIVSVLESGGIVQVGGYHLYRSGGGHFVMLRFNHKGDLVNEEEEIFFCPHVAAYRLARIGFRE